MTVLVRLACMQSPNVCLLLRQMSKTFGSLSPDHGDTPLALSMKGDIVEIAMAWARYDVFQPLQGMHANATVEAWRQFYVDLCQICGAIDELYAALRDTTTKRCPNERAKFAALLCGRISYEHRQLLTQSTFSLAVVLYNLLFRRLG